MKNINIFLLMMFTVLLVSGCLMRTYSIKKERVDQTISGNCGYITGTPSDKEKQPSNKTHRQINILEIELGPHNIDGTTNTIK
ncbi:MAG: hypothetical protein AB1755_00580 [Candidatus Omnitrophota bacterium]